MKRPVWFKRKTYGWGWTPATWQGWAVLGIYTGGVLTIFLDSETYADPNPPAFLLLFILTAFLLTVTLLTGERPRWQWGKSRDEK